MPIIRAIIGAAILGGAAWVIDASWITFADWHHCYFIPAGDAPIGDAGRGDCISTRTLAIIGAAFVGWTFGLLGLVEIQIGRVV